MKLFKVEMNYLNVGIGAVAEHNYPCPVFREEHAVFNCNKSIFYPSWKAQEKGYRLIKIKNIFQKVIYNLVFKDENFT